MHNGTYLVGTSFTFRLSCLTEPKHRIHPWGRARRGVVHCENKGRGRGVGLGGGSRNILYRILMYLLQHLFDGLCMSLCSGRRTWTPTFTETNALTSTHTTPEARICSDSYLVSLDTSTPPCCCYHSIVFSFPH